MTDQGPVCHLPPETIATTPSATPIPNIPVPQMNLASLLATVEALRRAVNILSGKGATNNGFNRKPDNSKSGSWKQVDIQTEKVKIYQNNDPTTGNFVEVERINSLTFANDATKQSWKYTRHG